MVLGLDFLALLLQGQQLWDQGRLHHALCLIQKEAERLKMCYHLVSKLELRYLGLTFDQITFFGDDRNERSIRLFDLSENNGIDSIFELIINFNFLNFELAITLLNLIILISQPTNPILPSKPNLIAMQQDNLLRPIINDRNEQILNIKLSNTSEVVILST